MTCRDSKKIVAKPRRGLLSEVISPLPVVDVSDEEMVAAGGDADVAGDTQIDPESPSGTQAGVKHPPESATPGSAGHVRKFTKSGLLPNGCGSLILRSMTVVRKVLVAITALLLALL